MIRLIRNSHNPFFSSENVVGKHSLGVHLANLDLPGGSSVEFSESEEGVVLVAALLKGEGVETYNSLMADEMIKTPLDLFVKATEGKDIPVPLALENAVNNRPNRPNRPGSVTGLTPTPEEGVDGIKGEGSNRALRQPRRDLLSDSQWESEYCTRDYVVNDCKCLTDRTGYLSSPWTKGYMFHIAINPLPHLPQNTGRTDCQFVYWWGSSGEQFLGGHCIPIGWVGTYWAWNDQETWFRADTDTDLRSRLNWYWVSIDDYPQYRPGGETCRNIV